MERGSPFLLTAHSSSTSSTTAARSLMKPLNNTLIRQHINHWNSNLKSLSVQSKLLDIIQVEKECHVWSRIMFGLPAGQMSFMIRAGIDCLPTPVNLCRWKIQTDPSCPLCHSRPCTVHHILNCCPTALNQERYTWRHDSILAHLSKILKTHLPDGLTLYADLSGLRASENPPSTIPVSLVPTTARPDIVIIQEKEIRLLELTIPINTKSGLQNARERKQTKPNYITLVNDLETLGFSADLETLEIGSLGHFEKEAFVTLHAILPDLPKRSITRLLLDLSKIAVGCSSQIFHARKDATWNLNTPPYSFVSSVKSPLMHALVYCTFFLYC